MEKLSVHDHEKQLMKTYLRIEKSNISRANKRIIMEFDKYCAAEGLSVPRRLKLLVNLHVYATRYFKQPFKTATPDQIWDSVMKIESTNYGVNPILS